MSFTGLGAADPPLPRPGHTSVHGRGAHGCPVLWPSGALGYNFSPARPAAHAGGLSYMFVSVSCTSITRPIPYLF